MEQPKDCGSDIIGCVASLAGTIASCAISVVQWELVSYKIIFSSQFLAICFSINIISYRLLLVLLLPLVLEILVMTVSVKLLNGLVAVMFVKNCNFEINFEKQITVNHF